MTSKSQITEDELRPFFEASLDNLCIAGFDGYFKYLNPVWQATLGFTLEELMAVPYLSLVHPEDVASTQREAQRLSEGMKTVFFENRYRCSDGSYKRLQWQANTVIGGQLIYAAARDVTAQREMEQQLRQTSQLQRAILDSANFTIIATRPDGIIQTFNAGALRELGYTEEEVIGKVTPAIIHDPDEVVQRAHDLTHELGYEVPAGFQTFIAKAKLGQADEHEWTYIRKDGSRFSVHLSITALHDDEGAITGYLGIGRNITERKQAEAARLAAEERMQAILDNSPAVVFMKDLSGRYLVINRTFEELFHITRLQIIGKTDADVFPPEMAAAFQENDRKVIAKGEPQLFEELAPHDDGPHSYLTVKFPLNNSEGKPYALCGIATDITGRRKMEEDLRRSNQDLEQFAYIASHDLKEPLRMISSYLQLLDRRYGNKLDGEAREFIGFAVDGALRLRRLIDDLLDFSRVGTHGGLFKPTDTDKVLQLVCDNLQVAIAESQAVITHTVMPTVLADAGQLGQVFQNIIANAIKFRRDEPPVIQISARRCGGLWQFSVQDNGIGIERKFFDRVFVIFQRLHAREKYEGTGIGLALCKRIIERHGGSMGIMSEPGQGSLFSFTLPAVKGMAKRGDQTEFLSGNDASEL